MLELATRRVGGGHREGLHLGSLAISVVWLPAGLGLAVSCGTPDLYIASQVVLDTTVLHVSFLTSQESAKALGPVSTIGRA